jgi:zinc/manganese transport system substrate-binding protein
MSLIRFFSVCVLFLSVSTTAQAKLNIFACEPEWAALSEELTGDLAKVYKATTAKQDPHRIEARPSLIAKMRRADLLVCSGAELEVGWLPLLVRQASNKAVLEGQRGNFEAAMQVDRLEVPERLDRSMGDVHASGNPHVQLDPHRLLVIAGKLAERLKEIDAGNAEQYQAKFDVFKTSWEQSIAKWESQTVSLKGKQVIVHHKNWSYLLDWLGIVQVTDLEPRPGLPPTAGHLAKVVEIAKDKSPFATLVAAYQSPRSADWLEEKTGVKALHLAYTVGGSKNADTLQTLYDEMIQQLLEAAK